MIMDVPHAVNILHVPEVATRVNDHRDGLETLRPSQAARDAGRKPVCAHIARSHRDGLGEIEPTNLSKPFGKIECFRQHYRVKRYRKPWRRPHNPIETTKDITATAAQCPVFQLEIYSIKVSDLAADGLYVSIPELSYAPMCAAQQKLIQLKHGHVKYVIELSLETSRVGGDTTQVIVSRDHSKPGAGAVARPPQCRSTGRSGGQNGRLRTELQRCHDCFLRRFRQFTDASDLEWIERRSHQCPKSRWRSERLRRAPASAADIALPP